MQRGGNVAGKMPGRNGGTLRRLEKGESGNPRGSSKKQRAKAFLRDKMPEALASTIGPETARKLRKKYLEGLQASEALATQILERALKGDPEAIRQIIALEPKQVELSGQVTGPERVDVFTPEEDDQQALLDAARAEGQVH